MLGLTGSGTRRLYTFFSPLFSFSVLVQLRTLSYVHRRMARVEGREKITSGIEREIIA